MGNKDTYITYHYINLNMFNIYKLLGKTTSAAY